MCNKFTIGQSQHHYFHFPEVAVLALATYEGGLFRAVEIPPLSEHLKLSYLRNI
jgi:hypothetical protein